mgnify:FL=1|tara:strand:+ start:483 stop:1526 length:1044 start_codon:yes stop_codon:yes gene_type:complete
MAKFLDKKERVIGLELTSYGKYLFSVGKFKPVYYAFFDDNVIYDGEYANINETQNNVHKRIKQETPYIESLVLFEDVGNKLQKIPKIDDSGTKVISVDTTPLEPEKPRYDNFRYDGSIGDSFFDSRKPELVPSWKIVALQSNITSSSRKETETSVVPTNIPQINIDLNYIKKIVNYDTIQKFDTIPNLGPSNEQVSFLGNFRSNIFADNKIIELKMDDPMIYIDEVNTQILNDNFDIEVFTIDNDDIKQSLTRKFFKNKKQQVIDGIMVTERPEINYDTDATTDCVEYYFDILKDNDVNQAVACKNIEVFNKQTYYLSLDFDCDFEQQENFYNDIYGSEVVPEICLD